MRFHPYRQAPVLQTDTVVGGSRIGIAISAAICLGFAVGGVLMLRTEGFWFGVCLIAFGTLFSVHIYRMCWMAFSGHDWQMRYDVRRILIKVSPTWHRRLDEIVALEIPCSEIAWIRAYRDTTITEDSDGKTARHYAYLEIAPSDADLSELREHITRASVKKKRWKLGFISGESTTTKPIPVSTTSTGQIRIAFRDPDSWLRPSLDKTIADLSRSVPVRPAVAERNDYAVPTADKEMMEKQILELAEKGAVLEAVKLARKRYGYSLTEAKRFVEELRGTRQ